MNMGPLRKVLLCYVMRARQNLRPHCVCHAWLLSIGEEGGTCVARGGHLRHNEVTGANDVIVTHTIPAIPTHDDVCVNNEL